MKFGIGQPVRRKEDVRFVTGRGRYTDDMVLENQAYAYFVRSPHAHAQIRSIDAGAAKEAPGVFGVLTHADIAGSGTMPNAGRVKNRDGSPGASTPKELLPADKVRFGGEAVAMIVAQSPALARDAAELVVVDYEPLPAVACIEDAADGARIWDGIPGNLVLDWADGDEKACTEAFEKSSRIVSIEIVQNRVVPNPMEPRAAIGAYDAADDCFTLYTATQGVAGFRTRILPILNIASEKLRIITPDVGGGFGQKAAVCAEQALVLFAAKKFGRPVKWTGDRSEAFLADMHGRGARTTGELALDQSLRILAIRVTGIADLGAYLSIIGTNVITAGGMRIMGGLYRVPVVFVSIKGYATNSTTISAYRGAGRPEAAYLMERMLDKAAAQCGIDRVEIRRRNLLTKEELPYRTWKGLTIDSGDFLGNLDCAVERADWNGFDARKNESARHGKLRGRGLAYYTEVSGGPPGPEPAKIRIMEDGSVEVTLGTQSNGQGHETSFAQIVADKLGVPFERVTISEGDTESGVLGLSSVGSRSIQTAGNSLGLAAAEIISKGKTAAAHILQAGGAEVEFTVIDGVGKFRVSGTDRAIAIENLAATVAAENLPGFEDGLEGTGVYDGVPTFPNGCHICEVEIDPDTGVVDVQRYTVVDDFGCVINPLLVEGQVHGGIAQGLGQALLENTIYDRETGQLLTASFLDYTMPRANDIPPIDFTLKGVPCTTNPLGTKGAGEAGTVGALPVLVSAVSDALGVVHIDMPATPERVWQTLRNKRAG